jgi:hypothetical protein
MFLSFLDTGEIILLLPVLVEKILYLIVQWIDPYLVIFNFSATLKEFGLTLLSFVSELFVKECFNSFNIFTDL